MLYGIRLLRTTFGPEFIKVRIVTERLNVYAELESVVWCSRLCFKFIVRM